jgi:UDP:flavonoid glycosyltransferase YjiC (YdhE family)
MKILIASTPALGHVNPMLSFGRILKAHGHRVLVQTASAFKDVVEQSGLGFRPLLPGADVDLRDVDAVFPERKRIPPGPDLLRHDFENFFLPQVPHQYAGLLEVVREWRPHAILADCCFFGTFPLLLSSRPERPPIVHCGISCLLMDRDDGAPIGLGLPPAGNEAQRREYAILRAKIDEAFVAPVQRQFDALLGRLGARALPTRFLDAAFRLPDLCLQPSVPGFDYPNHNMPAGLRFVGSLPKPRKQWPLPTWVRDVDGSRRVVLVTQGTVANHDLGQVIAPTLAALAEDDDLLVIATTGGRAVDTLPGPIPSNARIGEFLPYDWLMPKVDVVVTNGGYGTVEHALMLGIPLVVAGLTEDKAEIAARVAWSGVGINLASNTPSRAALQSAIREVLDRTRYRERARAISREFASYDSESEICRLIDEVVVARAEA